MEGQGSDAAATAAAEMVATPLLNSTPLPLPITGQVQAAQAVYADATRPLDSNPVPVQMPMMASGQGPAAVAMDVPVPYQMVVAAPPPPQQQAMMMSGFTTYNPPPIPQGCDFGVYGSDFSQILEMNVRPGESVTAERHTLLFMTPNIDMDMEFHTRGCACCAGVSPARLKLQNRTHGMERVALTPAQPAKVVPIDLTVHSGFAMSDDAFLGAKGKSWNIQLEMVKDLGVCCFGGQGLFLNRVHGDGLVFLSAGGSVMMKQLGPGEQMVIEPSALLAMERTVKLGIKRTGGLPVCACSGQGLFNGIITGPGWVLVHSMSVDKLRRTVGAPSAMAETGVSRGDVGMGSAGCLLGCLQSLAQDCVSQTIRSFVSGVGRR